MNLSFDLINIKDYKSKSQRARVLTENWMEHNMYCPVCGKLVLKHYQANRPVADFFCEKCQSEYELKSQEKEKISSLSVIPDGCYDTMIQRINSSNNPNLFIMTHYNQKVNNLIFIPKFFFTPEIIIKRPPLKESARRAGWVRCNINISAVPSDAKISIISDGKLTSIQRVVLSYNRLLSLRTDKLQNRGWLMDTMACIDLIHSESFSLKDVYKFENMLKIKHPTNNHVKDKLRQQLQILRDNGFIEFTSRGNYKKVKL